MILLRTCSGAGAVPWRSEVRLVVLLLVVCALASFLLPCLPCVLGTSFWGGAVYLVRKCAGRTYCALDVEPRVRFATISSFVLVPLVVLVVGSLGGMAGRVRVGFGKEIVG